MYKCVIMFVYFIYFFNEKNREQRMSRSVELSSRAITFWCDFVAFN